MNEVQLHDLGPTFRMVREPYPLLMYVAVDKGVNYNKTDEKGNPEQYAVLMFQFTDGTKTYCNFDKTTSKRDVADFLRSIATKIEKEL